MKSVKILLILLLSFFLPTLVNAANPSYTLRPRVGKVVLNSEFTVDILINSAGKEVTFARASLTFDPKYLEVIRAERNESLFCVYPEGEQSVDNDNGVVLATGYCQSGGDLELYKTTGTSDVFARVRFKALKLGTTKLEWKYTGEDESFMSVIMKDGSPTQNILSDKPSDGIYEIVKSIGRTPTQTPTVPETGIGLSTGMVIGGVVLVVLGFLYTSVSEKRRLSKLKTVVVYDKK